MRVLRRSKIPDDVAMMRNPILWPVWPYLPLKRSKGMDEELGVLWAGKGYRTTVFLACLYLLPPTVEVFLASPKLQYSSFEAIAADGWVID